MFFSAHLRSRDLSHVVSMKMRPPRHAGIEPVMSSTPQPLSYRRWCSSRGAEKIIGAWSSCFWSRNMPTPGVFLLKMCSGPFLLSVSEGRPRTGLYQHWAGVISWLKVPYLNAKSSLHQANTILDLHRFKAQRGCCSFRNMTNTTTS